MSYILEALKKSQQERELGQVPTLETGPFAGARRPARGNTWAPAALGLAALAVAIALYAVMRQHEAPATAPQAWPAEAPQAAAPPMQPPLVQPPAAVPAQALSPVGPVAPPLPTVPPVAPLAGPAVPAPTTAHAAPYQAEPRTQAAPAPWPAPPAAPLGGTAPTPGYPAPVATRHAPGDPHAEMSSQPGVMESEEWSDDWMEMDQEVGPAEPVASSPAARRPPRSARQAPSEPKVAPIPQDLRDEVAAFKDELRRERSGAKSKDPAPGDPKKLRLPDEVNARLPAFIMTAQIYDPDPTRRFVVINSLRYAVGETTREGLKVEQVLSDGVVLSFEGQRFFRRR